MLETPCHQPCSQSPYLLQSSKHKIQSSRPSFSNNKHTKVLTVARRQWLTPVILATQEAEIRRIKVQSQPGQIAHKTLSRKNSSQKGLVEWLKVKTMSSNPSTTKKTKNKKKKTSLWT
jgi:site-specific recombinase XerC